MQHVPEIEKDVVALCNRRASKGVKLIVTFLTKALTHDRLKSGTVLRCKANDLEIVA